MLQKFFLVTSFNKKMVNFAIGMPSKTPNNIKNYLEILTVVIIFVSIAATPNLTIAVRVPGPHTERFGLRWSLIRHLKRSSCF